MRVMRITSRLPQLDLATLRRIAVHLGGHLRPHRGALALSMLYLAGASLATLAQPWPLKLVFDLVLMPQPESSLGPLGAWLAVWSPTRIVAAAALAVLVLAALKGLFSYGHSVLSQIVGHKVVAEIRYRLFAHVQRLPQAYHDYRETGDLMTRLTGDVGLIQELLVSILIDFGGQVLLVVGMLVVMFVIDPVLALASMAILPLLGFAAFRFSWRIKKAARKQRESYGKMVDSMQESLAGIQHVKGFGQERSREKLVGKSTDRDIRANVLTTRLEANYSRIVELLNALGTCLVLWIGALRVQSGHLSAGDMLVCLAYLRQIYRPLQRMARSSTRAAKATVRGEKILEILDMPAELHDAQDAIEANTIRGEVQFQNVSFSYDGERSILHDLSLTIPAQKTTLIVGATGAGKSTIAKLIMRLYEPRGGSILIDGEDLNRYRIGSLRKRITPLAQETFLFRTTIAENIGFGRRHASRAEIEAAAGFVGADDFIRRLPRGYDTLVGEGGLTLSGGQRQWISFARAALRRSPIMILDEPATGLDVHAEAETKDVLAKLAEGRTLVIITHRLHFLDLADWVIFIRAGEVLEEGPVGDLMNRHAAFFEYVSHRRDVSEVSHWTHRDPATGGAS